MKLASIDRLNALAVERGLVERDKRPPGVYAGLGYWAFGFVLHDYEFHRLVKYQVNLNLSQFLILSSYLEKISSLIYKKQMITPEQIRGARAMLGLTQAQLASRAGISTTGLNNIESASADPKISTLKAIKAALESLGIEFIAENGGGAGVRFRRFQAG